jgi:hypothetical protein
MGKGDEDVKIISMNGEANIPLTRKLLDLLHKAFGYHVEYKII